MARYQEVLLDDGTQVQLRLTTGKLEQYLTQIGGKDKNSLVGVLDALTFVGHRMKLFTAALTWTGNKNSIKDGGELLDRFLDNGLTPSDIRAMILQLAAQAGLLEEDQLEEMLAAAREGDQKFFRAISDAVAGRAAEESLEEESQPDPTVAAEN